MKAGPKAAVDGTRLPFRPRGRRVPSGVRRVLRDAASRVCVVRAPPRGVRVATTVLKTVVAFGHQASSD